MSRRETTNSILMSIRSVPSSKIGNSNETAVQKNVYVLAGAPGELLTVKAAMELCRKKLENEAKEKRAKDLRKKKKPGK